MGQGSSLCSKEDITISAWNINGGLKREIEKIRKWIQASKSSIFFLCETKVGHGVQEFMEENVPGHRCLDSHRHNTSNSIGGGVCMMISRTLWQSCNMKRAQVQARSSIWVELDAAVPGDPEKLKILICGWYLQTIMQGSATAVI